MIERNGGSMEDLISRQEAIDALIGITTFKTKHELMQRVNASVQDEQGWLGAVAECLDEIEDLPSAQPEKRTEERTETHSCDYISRQDAIDAVESMLRRKFGIGGDLAEITLAELPSAQPDSKETSSTHKALDTISRQAAINALTSHIMPHNNEDGTVTIGVLSKSSIKNILNKLPSAQPEQTNSWYINSWCIDCKEYDKEKHSCPRFNRVIKQTLDEVYAHAETEAEARFHAQQRWIPCSERLPEENGQYLITVKYVHVDGYDDIYAEHGEWTDGKWDMFCFGHCGKVENIIAWMPLPEPYREDGKADADVES